MGKKELWPHWNYFIAIELYKCFVDDITALAALAPGTRLNKNENKMKIVASLIESDKEEPDDRRTFEELKQIAFSIYNHVQFNTDSPSSHQEGMFPVLDLQMFVGVDGTIMYKFYEKPCASKFVIPEMSAHSKQMKMSV